MVCRCCVTSMIVSILVGLMLGENIQRAMLEKREPASIDMILMAFMICLLVCALAVLSGVVMRKTKPIVCAMFLMLIIFLICTIRLGYIMYILGHAVQMRESRDRITRLGEATAVIATSWFFLLLSLIVYNRAREDIE